MKSEVFLLGSVHRLHKKLPFYTLGHLRNLIEAINPAVICGEIPPLRSLSHIDLERKPEIAGVILPYTRQNHIPLHPLQPGQPEREAMMAEQGICPDMNVGSWGSSFEKNCLSKRYLTLVSSWRSIQDVWSPDTGARLRELIIEQEGRFQESQIMAWIDWNIFYLSRILEAIQIYPHRRILAVVGLDRLHWLEEKLSRIPGINKLDPPPIAEDRERRVRVLN